MGFGMRKEVYTRKPKKVFEKVKEVYSDTLKKRKQTKATLSVNISDEKHSYKPFFETRLFKVVRLLFWILFLGLFYWSFNS